MAFYEFRLISSDRTDRRVLQRKDTAYLGRPYENHNMLRTWLVPPFHIFCSTLLNLFRGQSLHAVLFVICGLDHSYQHPISFFVSAHNWLDLANLPKQGGGEEAHRDAPDYMFVRSDHQATTTTR